MKRLVSFLLLLFLAFSAFGQFGNEWIVFGQPYFKIPTAQSGIYRITPEALQQAGLQDAPDPKTFQLFHRGKEVAVTVHGQEDGVFDATDYIEFYGTANDGILDADLYANQAHQPHQLYNLYSDTTSYFLTYGSRPGKRIASFSGTADGLSPETYHIAETLLILKESYSGGMEYGEVQATRFDEGEGWTGARILQGQEVTYNLEGLNHLVTEGAKPRIEVLLTGRGPMAHTVELYAAGRLLATVNFQGYDSYTHTQPIEWPDIDASGQLLIRVRVPGSGGADRVSVGYIRVHYPQQLTMEGVTGRMFYLREHAGERTWIKIPDAPMVLRLFDVTDAVQPLLISSVIAADGLSAVVPATTRTVWATASVLTPASIRKVSFRPIHPAASDYIIITHPALRKPAGGYVDPVKAYGEYRSLPEGGGFDTLIVNIDQLYDQFNYGERSPRAIHQFMKFLAASKLPEYLFLIGKGLTPNYGYWRKPEAFSAYKDLVPTAGYPASDMAFTAGLSGIPHTPAVATGRLTANSPGEVVAYLNKVKERDALPFGDLGRKRVLHLSGGIEDHEPEVFRDIMKGFEAIAEDVYLGGDVQALSKQSTAAKLVNIADEVNQGLGLITFFGHSAPNTLDFDIGLVTDPVMGYDNAGKYPFMLMNGCDVGSFFLNASIFGENWIKAPDKGAIGLIAHSYYGLVSGLTRYSTLFYDVAFGDSVFIGKGVGQVQQEVSKRYVALYGSVPHAISQVQQMVLLGDPAVKIFGASKPDYAIEASRISLSSFDEQPLTALADSFRLHIPVKNFGLARTGDFRVRVSRQYSDGTVFQYDSFFPSVRFQDTLTLVVRNADQRGFGLNTFTVTVDADDLFDELDESNNTVSYTYFIPLNSTRNLYPHNFGIVNTAEVMLSFQHTDPLSGTRAYEVEIDTAHTFDSGFKQHFQVSAEVLGRQPVALLPADTVVYYWRTRIADPLPSESAMWTAHSFTYISGGPEGWAQVRFPQYGANNLAGLINDPQLGRLRFTETVSDISIKTFSAAAGKPRDSVRVKINGAEFNLSHEGDGCRMNTLNLIAFNKNSTQPYEGIYFKWHELLSEYGGRRLLCGREPYVINSFTAQELITGNQDDLAQYVDNIHTGDSVVLFNIGNAGYSEWPAAAITKLGGLGISAAQVGALQDGDAVIIFGRKGSAPGTAKVFHSASSTAALEVDRTITGRFESGSMTSPPIGPAHRWTRLIVDTHDADASDTFSFAVLGIGYDNRVDTLLSGVHNDEDLSFIDAAQYPSLKVVLRTADPVNLTSVQLDKWLVIYEPVAEGLVFPQKPFTREEVAEGQEFSAKFGFINVGSKPFYDSLTVRYGLVNYLRPDANRREMRIYPPLPGDTTLFSLTFSTVSKVGLNDVEVFVNPQIAPEVTYANNRVVLDKRVNVLADVLGPVLDVTFDGRYILNNDFVSVNPVIKVRVWDENPFIRKSDTLGIRIFLAYPCAAEGCGFEQIFFSDNDVEWHAATDTSDFTAWFRPGNLVPGTYVLRVEASDASGNSSGTLPFEIAFTVKRERSITLSAPYPNPFSEESNFEVVVTGDGTSPYFYTLQILNPEGQVVAVLADHTLGLQVGRNTISWNGSDHEGNELPTGIYFYRLLITDRNDRRELYGKVVLLQ